MTIENSLTKPSGRRGNRSVLLQESAVKKTVGWPSPAQDYYSGDLDLNQALIMNPDSTFLVRVVGDAMELAGISHGDGLIVDRALHPKSGNIVIALVDDEYVVRRFEREFQGGVSVIKLSAAHPYYADIIPIPEQRFMIWGVVTLCIHYL